MITGKQFAVIREGTGNGSVETGKVGSGGKRAVERPPEAAVTQRDGRSQAKSGRDIGF